MKNKLLLILAFLLSVTLVFTLVSCDGDDPCTEHVDVDGDLVCDECGEELEPPEDEPCTEHVDEDEDLVCDECGEELEPPEDEPCTEHTDEDGNYVCDECGEELERPQIQLPTVTTPVIEIANNGKWVVNGTATKVQAIMTTGVEPDAPTVEISADGKWVINGTATKIAVAAAAENTATVTAAVKTGTSTDGNSDVYTLTFSNGESGSCEIKRVIPPYITVKGIEYMGDGEDVSKFIISLTSDVTQNLNVYHTQESYDSVPMAAYKLMQLDGYTGSFADFIVATVNAALDTFKGADSEISQKVIATQAILKMINKWDRCFTAEANKVKCTATAAEVSAIMSATGGSSAVVTDVTVIATPGSPTITAAGTALAAGDYIRLEENDIISNKTLTFSFKKDYVAANDIIKLGHGENARGANYVEITSTYITVYGYGDSAYQVKKVKHGLDLVEFVDVVIEAGVNTVTVTVTTKGGSFSTGRIIGWSGRRGAIFATSLVNPITDIEMSWTCSDYEKDIWLFGDSYFNSADTARWTSYLYNNGYDGFLLSSFSGRNSAQALIDFKQALTHGTPTYAVWCMGMNDADTETTISGSYIAATEEFLEICEEKGITPILSTIPNVPDRINVFKNEWVKESGHRYVDFAVAVGGEEKGSWWYNGMLHSDKVHPTVSGALALYEQFIADFPEITED